MYIVWVVVPIFLALDSAKLHNDLVRNGMVSHTQTRDVSSIVINMRCMYVKCDMLCEAKDIVNKLQIWDIVVWNSLIARRVCTMQAHRESILLF